MTKYQNLFSFFPRSLGYIAENAEAQMYLFLYPREDDPTMCGFSLKHICASYHNVCESLIQRELCLTVCRCLQYRLLRMTYLSRRPYQSRERQAYSAPLLILK